MPRQSSKKPDRRQEFDQAAFKLSTAERADYDGRPQPLNGTSRARGRAAQPEEPPGDGRRARSSRPAEENGQAHGRLASTLAGAELSWFVPGWFARSMLHCLIGRKNVGKSSCLAWLMSQAKRPVILPGYEEDVALMMLPRWRQHKVLLRSLLVLNDQHYTPSLQVGLIVSILRQHRADLLVVENLDSYLPDGHSANDSQAVRPYLEAWHAIAVQSGVCLVGTRHPGKDPSNLCPGSHCWEDVPRISVVLEREVGPPPRHWMWSHRCGVGSQPAPLTFELAASPNSPPVFRLAGAPDLAALQLAQAAPDAQDRTRLQAALSLLETLLAEDWVEARVVFAEAEKERLGEGTIRRAAGLLGVQTRREGQGLAHRSLWGRKGLDSPWAEADLP